MVTKVFNFTDDVLIGKVMSVDTSNVIISVDNSQIMSRLSIGHIIAVRGNYEHELLICLVEKVTRSQLDIMTTEDEDEDEDVELNTNDLIKASLIGTFKSVDGTKRNIFKRGVDLFPSIDSECFLVNGDNLQKFMNNLGDKVKDNQKLKIGHFANDTNSEAILDGDKLFQRHASVLGSTGSGKSWCVATILEKASELKYPNIIVFDMHGEYSSLTKGENRIAEGYKIAGAGDLDIAENQLIYLPFWLLNREEILSTVLDRSDNNAPNQSSRFTSHLKDLKLASILKQNDEAVMKSFTVDSPIPYSINELIDLLRQDDIQMKPGASKPVKGDWNGKLTRFISRLETKVEDKRYSFLYSPKEECNEYGWLNTFIAKMLSINSSGKGIKIIDFSEVPSDILPVVTGTLARIFYDVQFWMDSTERTPFTLLCDEAHLYLPVKDNADSVQKQALFNFERIAKEGRKYGVSLFVVSQRPSDVSKTILSQCNNFIILRLTNERDQGVIKNLIPDSLKGVTDCLPILDVGEALVLGDSILLPNRIKLAEPILKPNSNTIDFWKAWNKLEPQAEELNKAIRNMRAQSRVDV